ncbi:LysR substrate-binding domain-containing protein [Paraburkholderia sp. Tr-20389]|uniref:LysR substrate-binding domain-containing protein n=1 Tax=Paraburkholderia sp. Tr-20389 TaxID=2703903 RepID=UPI001F11A0BB|nr:LysR substrate-binding domain-containing protein [Paraburkholderia sp. Tr-20389]
MDKILSMRIFSRAVSSLEDHLQARLLQRTTRKISLTEPGERYYQKCKKILADLEDAEAEAGAGVAALPVHCVTDDIRDGRPVQLFPESRLQNTGVFAVYSSRHHIDAKIRTFIEFLTSHLRAALDSRLFNEHSNQTFGCLARVVENA